MNEQQRTEQQNEKQPYQILLFYKYVTIDDPEAFAAEHLEFCNSIGLKGRIYVAHEGINGTLSGTVEATNAYMEHMKADPRFSDIMWKVDPAPGHAFKKMKVKPRKEIVTWRLSEEEDVDPNVVTGKYLTPEEWYEAIQSDDVIIIDGRNDYEYEIGHFKGAIRPGVETTRDFPTWIRENLADYKDKKVLTYCTGGIRCEKLSGFLIKEGFQDVSQLHGGIVTYGKDPQVKGQGWEGKCYVFDERIAVPINQVEDKVIGTCYHCGKPEDRYVNCANPTCHKQHICCEECETEHRRSCSKECEEHPQNRYELENQLKAQEAAERAAVTTSHQA